jgi:uncharacterized protein
MILRRFFSSRSDLLSKFELFPSSENGNKLITSMGNHGLTFGNVSYKGPVIINQGQVFLWDVPQYGVGGRSSKTLEVNDPDSPFHEWSWEVFNMFENVDPCPEILVIGSGAKIVPFPTIFSQNFQKLGIQLEIIDSKNACTTYNLLSKEGRLVSAAILPQIPTSAKTGKTLVDVFTSF